ncbi:leukocyte immunoglobulin-like receptor subfamily B member 3 isoform X1 [Astyanax mexicanus]|uniref:leukocyte immunoglobulin-like receptor subfamily B member 3 isoform X1 n=1 Tax=Astyanax mexicanus TaxID=7994 RepID=UPI0020CB12B3|nr:leukocyte immunoglobulin-like receptor subfamily B member 3 isoform X1 [Astyanax mexicanus]
MLCTFILLFCFSADLFDFGLADPPGSPPAPVLIQDQNRGSSLVLRCQTPQGHKGRLFKLYKTQELVDTVQLDAEQTQAEFQLQDGTMEQETYYCCQYDNSMISPYTTVRAPPPGPIRPLTPPQLLVTPSDGRAIPGQMMHFHCQVPPTSLVQNPLTFVLRRRPWGAHIDQEVGRSSSPHFKVGPVSQKEGGTYTCLYQRTMSERIQNSDSSSAVAVNIAAHLPPPQLSHDGEGMLVCTGSPSYPGAHFSLYRQGADDPSARRHAPMVKHSAQFNVSEVHRQVGGGYQCQYSVLLGHEWAHSERSAAITLPCPTGSSFCSVPPTGYIPPSKGDRVDLALIIGSVSAALLFMLVVVIVGIAVHKHVKAAAVKRRQREQDTLWQQVHSRDHIVDLTLQRINFSPSDNFAEGNGRISVSEPIYDCPFSTFTSPFYK